MGKFLRSCNSIEELIMDCWIRLQFRAGQKRVVILVELRLEYSQPIKLREQESGRLADRAQRIVRMNLLPRLKVFLRPGKIQIIESHESLVEKRRWSGLGKVLGGGEGQPAEKPSYYYQRPP